MIALLLRAAGGFVPTELVAPLASLAGGIAVAIIVGAFAAYNRFRGNLENKMPTVQQIWDEQRKQGLELKEVRTKADEAEKKANQATADRDTFKTALLGMRRAFLSYVERVQNGGPFELTPAEHSALELPVSRPDEDDSAGQ